MQNIFEDMKSASLSDGANFTFVEAVRGSVFGTLLLTAAFLPGVHWAFTSHGRTMLAVRARGAFHCHHLMDNTGPEH